MAASGYKHTLVHLTLCMTWNPGKYLFPGISGEHVTTHKRRHTQDIKKKNREAQPFSSLVRMLPTCNPERGLMPPASLLCDT